MDVYQVDPTRDARWDALLREHPEASIFHTAEWLKALRQTYGYQPIAFTTSPPGYALANGLPFCRISSWLSGRRLVSLPFSDHCTPLVESPRQLACLLGYLRTKIALEKWRYVELRPADSVARSHTCFGNGNSFLLHKLDLRPSLNEIFQTFHKNCVQRKIQRAAREHLVCEEGRSDAILAKFYHLLLMTRRRHGLPAQPAMWFRNLIAFLGEKIKIRVASKDGQPIAGIVTLHYKQCLVYKYGCSDGRFNNLGGTQLLFWNAIQEAKMSGLSQFDMGRTDHTNPGLIIFKDRWGATRSELHYVRYPLSQCRSERQAVISRYVLSHVPSGVIAAAGRVLYKHLG